jgi:hypothetical protein
MVSKLEAIWSQIPGESTFGNEGRETEGFVVPIRGGDEARLAAEKNFRNSDTDWEWMKSQSESELIDLISASNFWGLCWPSLAAFAMQRHVQVSYFNSRHDFTENKCENCLFICWGRDKTLDCEERESTLVTLSLVSRSLYSPFQRIEIEKIKAKAELFLPCHSDYSWVRSWSLPSIAEVLWVATFLRSHTCFWSFALLTAVSLSHSLPVLKTTHLPCNWWCPSFNRLNWSIQSRKVNYRWGFSPFGKSVR